MAELIDCIDWPNGEGFTPCSAEYRRIFDERNTIYDPNEDRHRNLDDLSPEDYQRWNVLEDQLLGLQASGEHLGKGERF